MNNNTVALDVREDIRNEREPFSRIITAVAELRGDERLLLTAPFEPVPLFRVLEKQGFRHSARPIESGDWEVLFTRESESLSESCCSRREEGLAENHSTSASQSELTSARIDLRGFGFSPSDLLI